jgi:hypothetical protein
MDHHLDQSPWDIVMTHRLPDGRRRIQLLEDSATGEVVTFATGPAGVVRPVLPRRQVDTAMMIATMEPRIIMVNSLPILNRQSGPVAFVDQKCLETASDCQE